MESLRRPAVLAALAVGLLVLNVVLLSGRGEEGVDGEPVAQPATDEPGSADGADEDTDAAAPSPDPTASDDAEPTSEDGSSEDEGASPPAPEGLASPAAGTYEYASSGSWSLSSGGGDEEYELPATATAEVAGDAEWTVRLGAGDGYADRFTFVVGPDGGLDWTDWVLERNSPSLAGETVYTCSGDTAWYRPDEQGRVAQHVCTAGGITSTGSVEHVGAEEVTLGDGTVVVADRLLYAYTVSGPGVSGDGQLDLWLDPATGLRLQEQRRIATTSTSGGQEFEYREDVAFTLQSRDPA